MKVYVFGDQKDACIELANQLNGSGASALIGREEEDLKDIAGRIGRNFDFAIMVSDDPIKAAVQANRDSRLRAAACYNQKSLRSAAGERINLFILDPESVEKLDFSALVGRSQSAAEEEDPDEEDPQGPGLFRSVAKAISPTQKPAEKEAPAEKQPKEKPARKAQKKALREDDADDEPSSPRDGISGRLKDIFGIEDE
jgi:hypothetical protein